MSQLLINDYLNDLATLKRVSGTQRESVVREAFKDLLKKWGKTHNLHFIPEHEFVTTAKVRNYVDGALMHDLRSKGQRHRLGAETVQNALRRSSEEVTGIRSAGTTSSPTFTPSFTIRRIARPMRSISGANSRGFRSTPTSRDGETGARPSSTCTSAMRA